MFGDGKTPTEVLVGCVEDFGRSEPVAVLVIYVNEEGDICWDTSARNLSTCLGMIDLVRHNMLKKTEKEK